MSSKKIYLITNHLPFDVQYKKIKKLLPLGLDLIQYRNKSPNWEIALEEIHQLSILCKLFETPLIINDRLDVLSLTQADGLHLGENDLPVHYVSKVLPPSRILGATAKTVSRAVYCEQTGAQYLGVGAFYTSGTKGDAKRITTDTLREIRESVSIPIYGIGGLTPHNITADIYNHVDGFAVSGSLLDTPDPLSALRDFKSL